MTSVPLCFPPSLLLCPSIPPFQLFILSSSLSYTHNWTHMVSTHKIERHENKFKTVLFTIRYRIYWKWHRNTIVNTWSVMTTLYQSVEFYKLWAIPQDLGQLNWNILDQDYVILLRVFFFFSSSLGWSFHFWKRE